MSILGRHLFYDFPQYYNIFSRRSTDAGVSKVANTNRKFLDAYKARFGEIPSSPWPIYAADALNIIAYAVDKSGSTDSTVLAEYLRDKVDGAPGITGPIGFTKQGDREGVPFYLYVVDDQGDIVVSR
ncbi:MAG TPA: hypothetical protein PKI80_05435, partial [Deltaproteobacteria bacterium]|nr:hypothetical protein [Deltaproteobacteria bacterium]